MGGVSGTSNEEAATVYPHHHRKRFGPHVLWSPDVELEAVLTKTTVVDG